ncbi:hypothetical protein AHAS_Ahas15G0312900 [Arachis hypogaea]
MKLSWGLIHDRDKLWVKVMRAKYDCSEDILLKVQHRSGMKLAVDLHIPYLEIESDPSCAINFVQSTAVETHVGTSLVRSIKELLIKPQKVVIRHIFKEASQCVML